MKINLFNLNRIKMREFFVFLNENYFHADQVMKWIYHHYINDINKMTNLSIRLRKKLSTLTKILPPKIYDKLYSADGSVKWIMHINKKFIETIYIPTKKRITICISSQLGCPLKCTFCATGKIGFTKNLTVSEIIGQIWNIKKTINNIKKKINIVIMGMGEPLLNFKNIITAISIMQDCLGFNISKYNITLSTVGIVPALEKLINTIDIRLALSLHAQNDILRSKIIPVNKKYNIKSILHVIQKYLKYSKTNRGGVTIEYVMLHNVNDNIIYAKQLAKLLIKIPSKINLIPWNYHNKMKYTTSKKKNIDNFAKILINKGYIVTIRKNRGIDINGACGQLSGVY